MDLYDSLRVVRRRWPVVLAALLTGLVAGWVAAPGDTGPERFRAAHTMIVSPSGTGINLEQAALLATTGPVPQRVAAGLGLGPRQVPFRVTAVADTELASLVITARSTDRAQAEALADLTARELVVELSGSQGEQYEADLERLESQVAIARTRVDEIQGIPGASDGTDTAAALELQSARSELSSALSAVQAFRAQGPPQPPLQTVEAASARPEDPEGVQAPSSKPARAGLLGGLGLLLGLGAAWGLDRLDTRIHSKRSAEVAFGHPVVAEIPPLPRGAHGELLTETRPSAPFVEAYRALRTVVALGAIGDGPKGDGADRVLLVTSPMAGEGKTTTVAHLAATLAEVGRSVLVISADFRRPRLHAYFGQDREPGLTEALSGSPDAPGLADLVRPTDVPGVFLLPSGAPLDNPAAILERLGDLLRAARGLFDLVLVDGPPMLVANDASALAQDVDAVLIMARSGRTTHDAAERSAEILERVAVPVAGIVVTAAHDTPTAYRYYRDRYYAETDAPKRRFGIFGRGRRTPATDNGRSAEPAGDQPAALVEQER